MSISGLLTARLTISRQQVFETLGFELEDIQPGATSAEPALQPPAIDPATPEGKASRAKLLRAWVEVGAWLAIYEKSSRCRMTRHRTLLNPLQRSRSGITCLWCCM